MSKLYPDSGVELSEFISKHYDKVMNIATLGYYRGFIKRAIKALKINPNDHILDLGCGTGRNILLMNQFISSDSLMIGMDISENMEKQFNANCGSFPNIKFLNQRIDQEFNLAQKFDKIFISFVLHGFPNEIRKQIIDNAYEHLKIGGTFNILDFAEFDMKEMPAYHRIIFKKIECKYAFDFIEKDWKNILNEHGFGGFKEDYFLKKYVRLLTAEKI